MQGAEPVYGHSCITTLWLLQVEMFLISAFVLNSMRVTYFRPGAGAALTPSL